MPAASRSRESAPVTLADLRRELDSKEREARSLLARTDELGAEIRRLGETLRAMLAGASVAPGRSRGAAKRAAPAGRRGRGKGASGADKGSRGAPRENTLPAVLRSVLERVVGPMRVGELVTAVKKAGYASSSKNLNVIVANRLAKMPGVEKVERGLYQLRRDGEPENGASGESGSA